MQVPLTGLTVGLGDSRPGQAAELTGPIVGRQLTVLATSVAEVVAVSRAAAGPTDERLLEPRSQFRSVVGDHVEDDPQTVVVCLGDQRLGLCEGAIGGVYVALVDDVVAGVGHRRRVPGVDPNGIHAQITHISQPAAQTGDVPDPVTVPVGEAAQVHLVDDRRAPPLARLGRQRSAVRRLDAREVLPDSGSNRWIRLESSQSVALSFTRLIGSTATIICVRVCSLSSSVCSSASVAVMSSGAS